MNFIIMGSCLSNLTGVFLQTDYRWQRVNNNVVYNSGIFVKYFIEGKPLPPYAEVEKLLKFKPEKEQFTRINLLECFPEFAGKYEMPEATPTLLETFKSRQVDVILMDNLHDLTSATTVHAGDDQLAEFALYMPFHLFENEQELLERFKYAEPLDGRSSAMYWAAIVAFVRHLQPQAKIVFSCAPYSTSFDVKARFDRAHEFYQTMSALSKGWQNFLLLPPVTVKPELTKLPDDFAHFDMIIYKALAGSIFTHMNTSYLSNFD